MSRLRLLGLTLALVGLISGAAIAHADQYDDKINALKEQNNSAQNSLNGLQSQASSFQDAISQLQAQIYAVQVALDAGIVQQGVLQQQIIDAQAKIDQSRKYLGEDIKAMYVDGQLSTIEQLATSKNLSDYVDKEEYRTSVQNKIDSTIKQIAAAQAALKNQKAELDLLVASQKQQNELLSSARYQQQQLLSYNEGQQASFNSQIGANKSAIVDLQRQQFAANIRTLGRAQYGGTGNYPWPDAVQSSGTYTWRVNGSEFDPMGWSYRNCTSYAFWRLAQVRDIQLPASDFPNVYNSGGKIGYSIPDFRNLGYNVDHNPEGATLAVGGAGPYGNGSYGHIMFVESSDAGSAFVSQYNQAGDGNFSRQTIYPSSGIWFVHIP